MVDETSIGIALYRLGPGGGLEFLLLKHPEGHWDFPKGHVETGETEHATAARELAEETGLDPHRLSWVDGFRHTVNYRYAPPGGEERSKQVHYLAAGTNENSGDIRLSEEHLAWGWFILAAAAKRLTFTTSQKVLEELLERSDLLRCVYKP